MRETGEKILYGRDEEDNIVSIEHVPKSGVVEIFKREQGKVTSRYEDMTYFAFSPKPIDHPKIKSHKLLGNNHYKYRLETEEIFLLYDLRKRNDIQVPYLSSQYFLQSGKTCFKGMQFDDPLVCYFDLEVLTTEGFEFPNVNRRGDEIFMISYRLSTGKEVLFYVDKERKLKPSLPKAGPDGNVYYFQCNTEEELLYALIEEIRSDDPDVLANHNIFNFDLNYLYSRCQLYGIGFVIGRDGSEPKTFETAIKFADRSRQYTNFDIYGRSIIDTQFLAEYADVVRRDMPSYRLKDLVKYLGKADPDRVYIEGDRISDVWREKDPDYSREDLMRYALDDVREAEILYSEFGRSVFLLTHMIPMQYQEVFRYGTGNQIEYVFMREYLAQSWSYPRADKHRKIKGGYADVLRYGVVKGSIIYADVKSLYPTLAEINGVQPKKDELKIFQSILKYLKQTRYDIKAKIKQYKEEGLEEEARRQYDYDGSVKIFLNTMSFGFLAFGMSSFNDYDEAENKITLPGQEVVKTMINKIRSDGGVPIKVDTDGVALLMPQEWVGKEEEYCEELTKNAREGIIIECDGKYDGIMSFDKKSYVLLEKDGTVKIKGNTLTGRSIENFFTDFVKECILKIFEDKEEECTEIYNTIKEHILDRKLEADKIAKRSNINMTLEEYKNKNQSGDTQTLAQYELAINATRPYTKGDVISYYIKEFPLELTTLYNKPVIRKAKCKNYEAAELKENYKYDYEISYYTDRLETAAKKFMILGEETFRSLFPDVTIKQSDKNRIKDLTGIIYE